MAIISLRLAKQDYINQLKKEVAEKQRVKKMTVQVTNEEGKHLNVMKVTIQTYDALINKLKELGDELPQPYKLPNPYVKEHNDKVAKANAQVACFGRTWSTVASDVVRDVAYMARAGELNLGNFMRKIAQVIAELLTYYAIVSQTQNPELARAGSMLAGTLVGMFQEGGVVEKPTLAVVGEAGREYIIPERKLNNLVEAIVDKVGYSRPVTVEVRLDNMVSLSDSRVQRVIARAVQKGQRDLRMIGG